jgi:aminoglycoside phosphotransferase (APT) family kinase protein
VRTLNVRRLIEAVFREEPGLPDQVADLRFVARHHTSVYRVRAGDASYIVHVTPHGSEDLRRIERNLRRLEPLADARIPRVLAFRDSERSAPGDQRWAALVMSDIPGEELSSQSFNLAAWSNLCGLIRRLHAVPADGERASRISRGIDEAAAFPDFAETFVLHLSGLPLRLDRVRRHLRAMSEYVSNHRGGFSVPLRLIHGDLSRENIRVHGGQAGVIDWADLGGGDYAYDLAVLKFALDSVAPKRSADLIRELARDYRRNFQDDTLELRLRFFLALPGLVSAFWYANERALFPAARAWRVRTCYLHSEAQWQTPLCLDGPDAGAPVIRTEHWALRIPQPARGLFYLLAPKRVV